jgi:hypothetical protein
VCTDSEGQHDSPTETKGPECRFRAFGLSPMSRRYMSTVAKTCSIPLDLF